MADSEEKKKRKRVVVEEVSDETSDPAPAVDEVKPSEENSVEVKADSVPEEKPQEPSAIVDTKAPEPDKVVPPPHHYKEKKSFNLFFFFLTLFFAFLITVLVGGLYVYFNGTKLSSNSTPEPSATPLASSEPTTAPEVTAQASATATPTATNIKISILNGSGKSGEAGRAKALVEKAGFNVTSTGNASAFNFTDTQVQIKSTVSAEVATKIKDALKASYSVVDGKALDAKSQFDIIITVGSKTN